jgi:hypothetical protein
MNPQLREGCLLIVCGKLRGVLIQGSSLCYLAIIEASGKKHVMVVVVNFYIYLSLEGYDNLVHAVAAFLFDCSPLSGNI